MYFSLCYKDAKEPSVKNISFEMVQGERVFLDGNNALWRCNLGKARKATQNWSCNLCNREDIYQQQNAARSGGGGNHYHG